MKKATEYSVTSRSKDNGWQYIITGKVNNKWVYITSKQGFKKKKDADRSGESKRLTLEKLPEISKDKYTFKQVFDSMIVTETLSDNSVSTYKRLFKNYRILHDTDITKVTYIDIATILNECREKNRTSTLVSIRGIGKRTFDFAIKKLNISIDNKIELFEIKRPKQSDKKIKIALTESELKKLVESMNGYHRLLTALMCYTGMRISEARGLQVENIDFKNNLITINQQRTSDKKVKTTLKTENSYRTIPLPPSLKNEINLLPIPISGLLIPEFIYNQNLSNHYKICTPHELRHSYTTILIQKGIDFKTVAMLIGDSVEMVLKTYSHVNTDMFENAKNILLKSF